MDRLTEWLVKPYIENINEDINIPVNVGDTILVGRFKNKKMKVKSIGKDEHGMPTINGRKATTFRIPKKQEIKEGVNDPGILKCVFLAGGPGSGKTYMTKGLFGIPDRINVSKSGMKMVNSDKELKFLLKKFGFGTDLDKMPDELFKQLTDPKDKDYSGFRDFSKSLTKQRMKQYTDGRLGIIVDGTGHNYGKISKMKKDVENLGYDTYMIFINTTLEVALERNENRDRILPRNIVEKSHRDVMKNLGGFQGLFKQNFMIADNNEDLDEKKAAKRFNMLVKQGINKFVRKPIQNPIGKGWVEKQKILAKNEGIVSGNGTIMGAPDPKTVKKIKKQVDNQNKDLKYTDTFSLQHLNEFINKPKMKKAIQNLVDKNLIPKVYAKNTRKLQTFLVNNPMVMTQLLRILGEKVNEAFAVRGSKVEKFITGKNLTHKGKKYKEIEFETIKVDNPNKKVTLRILSPKKLFGQEVPVKFQTLRRGPFLKTDTGKKLKEQKEIKKVVGIYGGRFQPFGPHHKKVYEWMKKQFDEVYIVTSDIKSLPRHPMNFKEKVRHLVKMGIPKKNIVMEKTPYRAINTLKKFDEETTAVVYAFGAKDAGRLKAGAYFEDYKKNKNNMVGYREQGYIVTTPHFSIQAGGMEVSGTAMRQLLGSPKYADDRKRRFKKFFGYFDQGVYNMMTNKFSKLFSEDIVMSTEVIQEFLTEVDISKLLKESTLNTKVQIDDGPVTYYKGFSDYKKYSTEWIDSIFKETGWKVVEYALSDKAIDPAFDYTLKYRFLPTPSYGTTGVEKIASGNPSYGRYKERINFILSTLGYEVYKWMGLDDSDMKVKAPILPGADKDVGNTDLRESKLFSKDWWTDQLLIEEILEIDQRMTLEEGIKFNNFLKDWAKKAKQPLDKVRKSMMNKNTFSVAKLNNFSVEKVFDMAKKGFKAYQKIINYVPDKIAQKLAKTKFGEKKEKALTKLDDYLKEHPKLKRVMGLGAAAAVTYAWTKMTFIGDPEYDLDLSAAATAAATGDVKFADLFSGQMGTKFLVLTVVGATTGLTAPYVKALGRVGTMAAGVGFGAYRAYKARKQRKADAEKKTKTSVPDTVKNPNPKGRKKTVSRKSAVQWVAKNKGTKAAKKYARSLSERVSIVEELDLLLEGGAYGHMAHPFDDNNLTFGDLRNIIILGLGGKLSREDNVTEKLDGQNLMVSWVDGELRAARNKGHLKSYGKSSLTTSGVKSLFSGRGDVKDAFVGAMTDLENAIGRLSDAQKEKIFGNGKRWMNLEIMYPKTANVVDYDVAEIVFHGTLEYDESGKPIGQPRDSARMLAGMIKQVNANVQKTFKIGKPNFLKIPKNQNFGKLKRKFLGRLNKLQKQYALTSSDLLGDYHRAYWEEFIFNASKQFDVKLKNNQLVNLVNRWAFFDKSYKIPTIKKDFKDNPKFLDWVLSTDKQDHMKMSKKNIKPFEVLFFEVGAEILKNVSGYIAVSPDKTVQKIRKEVITAIKDLKQKKNVEKLKSLRIQLEKLKEIGGLSAVVPSEGIVFKYKGNIYKFTGAFAPINQILGSLKF